MQGLAKVSKQQNCLNKIGETGRENHLLQTIVLVTDGSLSLVFSKILKEQHNFFGLLSLNAILKHTISIIRPWESSVDTFLFA